MPTVTCPHCRYAGKAPDAPGRSIRCPRCKASFTLPNLSAVPVAEIIPTPTRREQPSLVAAYVAAGITIAGCLVDALGALAWSLLNMPHRPVATEGAAKSDPVVQPPPPAAASAAVIHDDADLVIWRYGKPDVDRSSADETPRPLMVIRRLTYEKEHVSFWYAPEGKVGDPPPYKRWRFLFITDSATKEPLDPGDAAKRLAGHDRGYTPDDLIDPEAKLLHGRP
jgi:hypothetical protein